MLRTFPLLLFRAEATDNHQRLVRVPLNCRARGLRLVPLSTWGAPDAHVFAFDAR